MNLTSVIEPTVLAIEPIDFLISLAALAASVVVRPWRLLSPDSHYRLLPPLLVLGTGLPLMWWWMPDMAAPVVGLIGAQLALLTLGWPLAVLLFGCTALAGVLGVDASAAEALAAFAWVGVVPATLGLAAGHLVRVRGHSNPMSYLLGRAFIVALFATFGAALLAQWLSGRYDGLGTAVTATLFLISLLNAMVTGACMTLLIVRFPASVATWSDGLYFSQAPSRRSPMPATPPGAKAAACDVHPYPKQR